MIHRAGKIEGTVLLLGLLAPWPYIFGWHTVGYSLTLLTLLAALIIVSIRRWKRFSHAMDTAQKQEPSKKHIH